MKIGLGLPNAVQDVPSGRLLVDLAVRAEALGFSTLATLGRIAYPNYEELVTLAAAAGATERIGLFTDVLLGPAREPVLLAKQAASLDQLSAGRLVLGVGVGGREDDFAVSGHDFHTRGRRWDEALELIHQAWRGETVPGSQRPITPRPHNGESVPLLIGGRAEQAIRRTVRYGAGYTQGGGSPESLRDSIEKVTAAWQAAGRAGKPEFRALVYFALGDDAQEWGERSLRDYYGPYGERAWAGAIKDVETARRQVQAYTEVGCDELVFFVTAPAVTQAERLAGAVL
jgi:alkanesulfonate monooxygenase SsuD/methylene tetrahydromethanopterin reductase-like flavin-dependent oxidoreductase (luciferase family)